MTKSGSEIFINGVQHFLGECIGRGTEGNIYSFDCEPEKIAKIYHEANNESLIKRKIELMLTYKIDFPGICWPQEIITTSNGDFLGFLMPKAKGNSIQRSIFIKPLFEQLFPNWTRKELVQLCITILEKINYLHNNNILIGDISPENIFVASPVEVYFIDCDSYQIAGFPCPIGTVNFTPPELQGKQFDNLFRTFGNEYFSVAMLLFMLLMLGKSPYSQEDNLNSRLSDIENYHFLYPFGEFVGDPVPKEPWIYIWDHFPDNVQDVFYNTFMKNAPHAAENTRYTTEQWLAFFRMYKRQFDSGIIAANDEQSEWIFPTRPKIRIRL